MDRRTDRLRWVTLYRRVLIAIVTTSVSLLIVILSDVLTVVVC